MFHYNKLAINLIIQNEKVTDYPSSRTYLCLNCLSCSRSRQRQTRISTKPPFPCSAFIHHKDLKKVSENKRIGRIHRTELFFGNSILLDHNNLNRFSPDFSQLQ